MPSASARAKPTPRLASPATGYCSGKLPSSAAARRLGTWRGSSKLSGTMGPSDDADLEAIIVPASAKFGGGALLLLGVLTLVLCLQTVLVVARYDSLMVPIISVM